MHTILINNIVKDTHLAGVGSRTATGARGRWPEHGAAAGARGGGGRRTGRTGVCDGATGGGRRRRAGRRRGCGRRQGNGGRAVGDGAARFQTGGGGDARAERNGRRAGENETARGPDPR
jgi:hypothetical protein